MNLDPQAFEGWEKGLVFSLLILFGGELALLALRQLSRRKRIGFLQHAWVASAVLFTFLGFLTRVPPLLGRLSTAAVLLLSVHVAYVAIDELLLRRPWDRETGPFLPKLGIDVLRTLLLVAAALFVAQRVFGAELSAILVSSTVLSAVLGFALQDVLRNVFAGMAIQVEAPFEIGHWLMIDGQPAQVTEMTWRTTRLRTNEGHVLIEPNADIASARLEWLGTGDPPVAFGFRVGLGYDIPPAQVKEALLEAAMPPLLQAGGSQRLLLVCPEGSDDTALQEAFRRHLEEKPSVVHDSDGDLVLCYEAERLPLATVAARLIQNRPDYAQAASRLHTRIDVKWTPLLPIE